MAKNSKVLLVCCFIVGCVVTFFVSGCSKPVNNNTNVEYQYPLGKYLDILPISEEGNKLPEKITIYTSFNENNEPIKMASCKGCHFVCPKCIE